MGDSACPNNASKTFFFSCLSHSLLSPKAMIKGLDSFSFRPCLLLPFSFFPFLSCSFVCFMIFFFLHGGQLFVFPISFSPLYFVCPTPMFFFSCTCFFFSALVLVPFSIVRLLNRPSSSPVVKLSSARVSVLCFPGPRLPCHSGTNLCATINQSINQLANGPIDGSVLFLQLGSFFFSFSAFLYTPFLLRAFRSIDVFMS